MNAALTPRARRAANATNKATNATIMIYLIMISSYLIMIYLIMIYLIMIYLTRPTSQTPARQSWSPDPPQEVPSSTAFANLTQILS